MGEIDRNTISRNFYQLAILNVPSQRERRKRRERETIILALRSAMRNARFVSSSIIVKHIVVTEVKCKKHSYSFLQKDRAFLISDADDSKLVISRIFSLYFKVFEVESEAHCSSNFSCELCFL